MGFCSRAEEVKNQSVVDQLYHISTSFMSEMVYAMCPPYVVHQEYSSEINYVNQQLYHACSPIFLPFEGFGLGNACFVENQTQVGDFNLSGSQIHCIFRPAHDENLEASAEMQHFDMINAGDIQILFQRFPRPLLNFQHLDLSDQVREKEPALHNRENWIYIDRKLCAKNEVIQV
uniref:Uncharacterized protein n=1 Tax=Oryza brachyantha TaxID=4533 RepID=J3N9I0_ORYBR